jgi:hypothetical protein
MDHIKKLSLVSHNRGRSWNILPAHMGAPLYCELMKIGVRKAIFLYTVRFIMFCVITNIYNKKSKGPTLMELLTATGKLKKFFLTTRGVQCVHHR